MDNCRHISLTLALLSISPFISAELCTNGGYGSPFRIFPAVKHAQLCRYRSAIALGARAVGQACGANRLPIVIPCHRVIAKNGGLGGFMNSNGEFPLDIKRWLLGHE